MLPGAIRDLILCVRCPSWSKSQEAVKRGIISIDFLIAHTRVLFWMNHLLRCSFQLFLHLLLITFSAALEGSIYMIPVRNSVSSA